MLSHENKAGYAFRYQHCLDEYERDRLGERYVLETTETPLHPYAVAKAVDCYEYQSDGRTSGPTPAQRPAALPRFADDVDRVSHWTGWDLAEWRR